MTIRFASTLAALVLALVVAASAVADVQSIPADDAFAHVTETQGVVFVDLYADW